jgi:hypothetical protein
MSHPHLVAARWLYATLAGDAALAAAAPGGIHDGTATEGATYPLVRLQAGRSRNVSVLNGVVVMAVCPVDVTVVGQTASYGDIEAAAARLFALLQRQRGSVAGGQVLSCVETAPLAYPELATGGVPYRHLGGTYELLVALGA